MNKFRPIEFTIEEGNRIILEYAGWIYRGKARRGFFFGEKEAWYSKGKRSWFNDWGLYIDGFKYHESFDWLMPICKSLREYAAKTIPSPITEKGITTTTASQYEKYKVIDYALKKMDIEELWYSTVWYINWLKENKHI